MKHRLFFLQTLFSLWIIISACGRTRELGEYSAYVEAFENEGRAHGQSISAGSLVIMDSDELPSRVHARCHTGFLQTPTILVNKAVWPGLSENTREAVMFHELGHCVLGRNHKDDVDEKGTKISLMHTFTPIGNTYASNREHFLTELFTEK
jgi:hypothetical protein